jgi:hypothetical protein
MIAVLATDQKQFICFVDSYTDHLASWESKVGFDEMKVRCLFVYVHNMNVIKKHKHTKFTQLVTLDGWHKVSNAEALANMVRRRLVKPDDINY